MMVADLPLLAMSVVPVKRAAQVAVERLLYDCWVPYMHGHGGVKPSGYPKQASGGVTGYTSLDLDNVAAYENLDRELAEKIDAVIKDMSPVERCAIHHKYLHAVFRFQREALPMILDRAFVKLEIGLRRRNVWLG